MNIIINYHFHLYVILQNILHGIIFLLSLYHFFPDFKMFNIIYVLLYPILSYNLIISIYYGIKQHNLPFQDYHIN